MMTTPSRRQRFRGMRTACLAGALSLACAADPRVGREAETDGDVSGTNPRADVPPTPAVQNDAVTPPDAAIRPEAATVPDGSLRDAGPPQLPPCGPLQVESDSTHEVRVRLLTIRGEVNRNGMPLPIGAVEFLSDLGGDTAPVLDGRYEAVVPPGTYRIQYFSDFHCDDGFDCDAGLRVLEDVEIREDGALDLNFASVRTHGIVTIDGETPDDGVVLSFTNEQVEARAVVVQGRYEMEMSPGAYAIRYEWWGPQCDGLTAPAAPCTWGEIRPAEAFLQDQRLDLHIQTARLRGVLSDADGFPLPPGRILLGPPEATESLPLGADGGFAVTLLPGVYPVGWSADLPGPSVQGWLDAPVEVLAGADAEARLVVRRARLDGRLTLDGAPFPVESGAELELRGVERVRAANARVRPSGPAFAVDVFPGTYDVFLGDWEPTPGQWTRGPLARGVVIAHDRALTLDVRSVAVSARIRNAVSPPPGSELRFQSIDGAASGWAGFDGNVASTRLLPGRYVVHWAPPSDDCRRARSPGFPCMAGPIGPPRDLDTDTLLELDLPVVQPRFTTRIEGAEAPISGSIRYQLRTEGEDAVGETGSVALDQAVSPWLLAGIYTATVQWSDSDRGRGGWFRACGP